MANATWKAHERRVARAMGGRRVGPTGREGPDVDAGWLVAECKHRALLPGWIDKALAKIRHQAGPQRLGVVVAHQRGARDSWVVVSLADWRDWFGDVSGVDRVEIGIESANDAPGTHQDAPGTRAAG